MKLEERKYYDTSLTKQTDRVITTEFQDLLFL